MSLLSENYIEACYKGRDGMVAIILRQEHDSFKVGNTCEGNFRGQARCSIANNERYAEEDVNPECYRESREGKSLGLRIEGKTARADL